MTKLFYLLVDFFNKFYELEMKICAKEARRLKSKIEFRRLMEKMKKRFLDFLAQYEVYGYLKQWVVDLVRRICKLGKGAQIFLRKRRRWAFSLNKYASRLGSTNLSRILRFDFSYEADF